MRIPNSDEFRNKLDDLFLIGGYAVLDIGFINRQKQRDKANQMIQELSDAYREVLTLLEDCHKDLRQERNKIKDEP